VSVCIYACLCIHMHKHRQKPQAATPDDKGRVLLWGGGKTLLVRDSYYSDSNSSDEPMSSTDTDAKRPAAEGGTCDEFGECPQFVTHCESELRFMSHIHVGRATNLVGFQRFVTSLRSLQSINP